MLEGRATIASSELCWQACIHQYVELISKYDFLFLHFPVPLSSVGSFPSANNMFINVYGVDDDKKVIYPLRVSSTPTPLHSCQMLTLSSAITRKGPNFTRIRDVDLPTSRNSYQCIL